MEKSSVLIMAELKILLQDGALPTAFVRRNFKEKGLTEEEFKRGCEYMNLIFEVWCGAEYIRHPKQNENHKDYQGVEK